MNPDLLLSFYPGRVTLTNGGTRTLVVAVDGRGNAVALAPGASFTQPTGWTVS